VSPRTAGVEPVDGGAVRKPIGETEAVVDVVDVAVPDTEVLFDALRMQDHPIDDARRRVGRETIADRQQVVGVAFRLVLPAGARDLVWHPLHEQRRADVTRRIRHARIERGMNVPFDARKLGQAPIAGCLEGSPELCAHAALVGQEVDRGSELTAIFGQAGERGQAAQREVQLERGARR
jgi:hypothetical protein